MNITRNHNSVADIINYNLTTKDNDYVENYQLNHDLLLQNKEEVSGAILRSVVAYIPKLIVANALGMNPKNISRLAKKSLNRYRSDVLIDLSGMWCELRQFFGFDENSVREWVNTPLPSLAGLTPALLMGSIAGRRELRQLLQTMRIGDFC